MASPAASRPGLRAVARRAVQREISDAALQLFTKQGFEQTTVEQIAEAVGMSGRSVFRYFPTKEDMVVGSMVIVGDDIAAALGARPSQESAWEALRRALDGPLKALREDEGTALSRTALMTTTPALRAAQTQKHAQWTESLVPGIARRVDGSADSRRLQAQAIVGAILACLDVAVAEWSRSEGKNHLDALLDSAIAAVRS